MMLRLHEAVLDSSIGVLADAIEKFFGFLLLGMIERVRKGTSEPGLGEKQLPAGSANERI